MRSVAVVVASLFILTFFISVGSSQQPPPGKNRPPRLTNEDLSRPSGTTVTVEPAAPLPSPKAQADDSGEQTSARGSGHGMDAKLRLLASLPVGIGVTHFPNPATARRSQSGKWPYVWPYRTTVRSVKGRVKIQEFGTFARRDGQWHFSGVTGRPYAAKDFQDWYDCEGGVLVPGGQCTDPQNWSGRASLQESQTLWYYIGWMSRGGG